MRVSDDCVSHLFRKAISMHEEQGYSLHLALTQGAPPSVAVEARPERLPAPRAPQLATPLLPTRRNHRFHHLLHIILPLCFVFGPCWRADRRDVRNSARKRTGDQMRGEHPRRVGEGSRWGREGRLGAPVGSSVGRDQFSRCMKAYSTWKYLRSRVGGSWHGCCVESVLVRRDIRSGAPSICTPGSRELLTHEQNQLCEHVPSVNTAGPGRKRWNHTPQRGEGQAHCCHEPERIASGIAQRFRQPYQSHERAFIRCTVDCSPSSSQVPRRISGAY